MSYTFDSFANRGEYLSAHYFSEELENTLKKKSADDEGLFTLWTYRETDQHDTQSTPRELLLGLHTEYAGRVRPVLAADDDPAGERAERLAAWHTALLAALGYGRSDRVLPLHNAGRAYELPVAWHGDGIVALDCGWTDSLDDALDADGAGRLLNPLKTSEGLISTGEKLAGWLFQSELHEPGGEAPRFVLLLCGGVIVLADRTTWSEGRYLAASVDAALLRNDTKKTGELALLAALFSLDMLAPRPDGKGRRMDDLLKASRDNAVGVNSELRKGLQRSVEIIANEVLARLKESEVTPRQIEDPERHGPFAKQLTRESLRYLYRILFLLYAEARPELGILPADDSTYEAGYSVARLRELVSRDRKLVDEESKKGFHLYASLDVLFNKVNYGHRPHGTEPGDHKAAGERSERRGLRFEPLRSELFDPKAITLIGRGVRDPRVDADSGADELPKWLDLRLRNEALHEVLRLLTMKEASAKGRQGGFISYRNLGINQLGAVYEGLMSYTGIIDDERMLAEVAKPGAAKSGTQQHGDPEKGSWLIPADRLSDYPANTHVVYSAQDAEQHGLRGPKKYEPGRFVYRLAGRDRETSASYYTPESLTKVTVELALKHRLDQKTDEDGKAVRTRASELLRYTICEPALGSGAFLNEAINQVAEAYLKRRQEELGLTLDTSQALEAKQKVKAYIALHNAYGVDLNATGVELAEVSLWLNTMHPGMRAPWFGLHLRRGNSLIGARRWVYAAEAVKKERTVAAQTPTKLPFRSAEDGTEQPLPEGAVHQFLLPSPGWGAVADAKKLVEQLAGEQVNGLKAWRKTVVTKPKATRGKSSQLARLQAVAERVEYLWRLVAKRLELSEQEIARTIDVWGADRREDAEEYAFLRRDKENAGGTLPLTKEQVFKDLFEAEGSPYWRLKQVMDAWCALWFWPLDKVGLLDGSDPEYATAPVVTLDALLSSGVAPVTGVAAEPVAEAEPAFVEHGLLFALPGDQLAFGEGGDDLVERREIKKAGASGGRKGGVGGPVRRRDVIALTGLDDWLAFLESMVGTGEVPEGTFATSVDSLAKLKDLEKLVEAEMGMDDARKAVETRYPWMRTVRDIAAEQGFLHWELDYAGVFAGQSGGFDLQVGNPPWVRPQWKEDPVLAEFEPWFMLTEKPKAEEKSRRQALLLEREEVQKYLIGEFTNTITTASYLSDSAVYPLVSGTKPDLYRAFMCEVWDHASVSGTAGMVHPDTHFSGDKEARLRAAAYRRLRVHGDFVNAGNRFFPPPVGRSSHFGVHIYGSARIIAFDSLSWLFTVDTLRLSAIAEDNEEAPGVKYQGEWDERPHPKRVIRVTPETLQLWRRFTGDGGRPEQTPMLMPVSTAEAPAIKALARYPLRIGQLSPEISIGFDEGQAKKAKFGPGKNVRLIDYNTGVDGQEDYHAESWEDIILKGPQLGVANPMFKQPSQGGGETRGLDLRTLADDAVPESEYQRVAPVEVFQGEQERWIHWERYEELLASEDERAAARLTVAGTRRIEPEEVAEAEIEEFLQEKAGAPYSGWYRLAWREMIAPDTERALYAALIPPGTTHIHAVRSARFVTPRLTALAAGFMAALPVDYLLRTMGVGHLEVAQAKRLPQAQPDHPLAPALLLRTLRLNALTTAYADLWDELYDSSWAGDESWAIEWPGMKTELHAVTPSWQRETPLRTEYARRAALVEIDALVAVWLGIDADTLVAMYRARFPIMQDFDRVTWFDANERKIAGDRYTYGFDQTKEHWQQFEAHQEDPAVNPVPDGYAAPFYKADREAEMGRAHAHFTERLNDAVAKGLWDPTTMEVPKP
ncbi:type II restriction/modification system endonuclease and methylase domain-containing protein [Kitasatospora sp. Ki12]